MHRAYASLAAVVCLVVLGSCQSQATAENNRFGDCTFTRFAKCTNQNLQSLDLQSDDLTGADFSGSDLSKSDLRYTILRRAKLVGTTLNLAQLEGADLRDADLSGAKLFSAEMEGADWTGANLTGVRYCQTALPDGSFSDCKDLDVQIATGAPKPPSVLSFDAKLPTTCLNDAIGEGIEVEWRVKNATAVSFNVDDVQATTSAVSNGVKRVPVQCDGKLHHFGIQAFGAAPPIATESFDLFVPR
jgi:hypothetical protein